MNTEEAYKDILFQLLHEIRQINHVIKSSSEIVSKAVSGKNIDKQTIEYHVENIIDAANLSTLWLDIADFRVNPELFETQQVEPRNIYGKFYKHSKSFSRIAKKNGIKIELEGNSNALIDSYPIIDVLPYILFDNAVKYSPKDGHVSVSFDEDSMSIGVAVSSLGPHLNKEEIDKVFDYGFRGRVAKEASPRGMGAGLSLAKWICDIHDIDIDVSCSEPITNYNDNPYSYFTINMKINRLA